MLGPDRTAPLSCSTPALASASVAMVHIPVRGYPTGPGSRRMSRPKPKTSSERGRKYRRRQKAYEEELEIEVQRLRMQIAQLSFSKSIWNEKALLLRTSQCGSVVQLTRELYILFRDGLESMSPRKGGNDNDKWEHMLARMQFKENFLRRVLDVDVDVGGLIGVDAVVDQWRKHTASYSKFALELGVIEPVAGTEENPIVVIHTKVHVQFSRETLRVIFPFIFVHRREDLVQKLVGKDFTLINVVRLQYSEAGQIISYSLEINFVEALARLMGNAREVAELMQLSVISSDTTTLADAKRILPEEEKDYCNGKSIDGYDASVAGDCETESDMAAPPISRKLDGGEQPQRNKLSLHYLLSEEVAAETHGDDSSRLGEV